MSVWKCLRKVVIVRLGDSLNDSMFGEFGVLDNVGRELSFGLHREILGNCEETFELRSGFEKHFYCL